MNIYIYIYPKVSEMRYLSILGLWKLLEDLYKVRKLAGLVAPSYSPIRLVCILIVIVEKIIHSKLNLDYRNYWMDSIE